MSATTEEIRDTLTFILNKLQTIDTKLERQEEDIKAYIAHGLVNLDSNELLIAGLKSTRTSFELLRDEIDELQQVAVALLKRGKGEENMSP